MAKKQTKKKKTVVEEEKKIYEGNLYDKIFKEDAEQIFMPLVEKTLGVKIKSFKPFKAKVQTTLEREMDFFYVIVTDTGEEFLLHLEFQTENEPEMVYRKAEYHGIALNLQKMEIKHVVIYVGIEKPTMATQLPEKHVYRGFDLVDVQALDHNEHLQSQVPDVIILAILADYPPEKAESILRIILRKLKAVCENKSELSKYIKQLVVLSRLRKIEELTIKIAEEMPITYDIDTDYLYKIGTKKGIEIGTEKGIEIGTEKGIEIGTGLGIEKEKLDVIRNARHEGASIEFIARIVKLPPEQVRHILDDLGIE